MIDTYNLLFLIFLNFTIISVLTTSMKFSAWLTIMEQLRCCNKILKLPFCKSKLGMQSLPYLGPSTWNKLPNNLKTATSVNCFKHDIKKLSKTEADICSYAKEKILELEHNQDKYIFCFYFFSTFKYLKFLSMLSMFPLYIYIFIFRYIIFPQGPIWKQSCAAFLCYPCRHRFFNCIS